MSGVREGEGRIGTLEDACAAKGMRMTDQRRIIAACSIPRPTTPTSRNLRRASAIDAKISIATVYRTVKLFEDAGVITRHDFGCGPLRVDPRGAP
jgi:Fur family ferric uptake transcriptional regulator